MDENRYPMTGVIIEIGESKQYSPYFKKRECKLRISDTDFTGKIVERKIKFGFINENCELLDMVRLDDTVTVKFYIDGRDIEKDGKVSNFTSNVVFDLVIINSPSRTTDADRKAVVTADGLVFKEPEKEATINDLMNIDYNKFLVDPDPNIIIPEPNKNDDMKMVFGDLPF